MGTLNPTHSLALVLDLGLASLALIPGLGLLCIVCIVSPSVIYSFLFSSQISYTVVYLDLRCCLFRYAQLKRLFKLALHWTQPQARRHLRTLTANHLLAHLLQVCHRRLDLPLPDSVLSALPQTRRPPRRLQVPLPPCFRDLQIPSRRRLCSGRHPQHRSRLAAYLPDLTLRHSRHQ